MTSGEIEVLAEDPEADVDGVVLHPDTQEPQIVTVLKDRTEYRVLDSAVEADLKAIRALHPGDPSIGGREHADSPWLVAFNNDTGPVAYYVYDPAGHSGRYLFDARPELNRYELAAMEPFSFTLPGRPDHPRVRDVPARRRAGRPAGRARRARRPAGS